MRNSSKVIQKKKKRKNLPRCTIIDHKEGTYTAA